MASKKKNTLLWHLSGDGIKDSYLFGSIHLLSADKFGFAEVIQPYLEDCKRYVAELDIEEAEKGIEGNELDLKQHDITKLLTYSQHKRLKVVLQKYLGIDIEAIKHSSPVLLQGMLLNTFLQQEKTVQMDQVLWDIAKQQKLKCSGLESVADQIKVMQDIPEKEQKKMLVEVIKHPKRILKAFRQSEKQYLKQDIQQLYKSTKKVLGGSRRVMLYDRNIVLAAQILKHIQKQSTFATIGAAHLGGAKGVLKILKDIGVKVKPEKLEMSGVSDVKI